MAAWGPNRAFLVTSPNVTFIPEIVQGIITVHLRDNGAFGKHDPIQWPQIHVSQYPYLAAIPKRPMADLSVAAADSAMWNDPSPDDFLEIPNTPVRRFGRFRPQFLNSLEPVVAQMSSKCSHYEPPRSTIDVGPLRQYAIEMTQAWQRLLHTSAPFRDQMLQLCTLRRFWLLCSAFMTFYYQFRQPPSATEPLPVNLGLMGAWTLDPCVAQIFFLLGIPVWFVRAPHVVTPDIRVARFVAIGSSDALCHAKFYGDEPVYRGLSGVRHLEVTLKSNVGLMCVPRGYRDLSTVPTATSSNPDDYISGSSSQRKPAYQVPATGPQPRPHRGSPSRPVHVHTGQGRYRPLPCKYLHACLCRVCPCLNIMCSRQQGCS